MINDNKLNNKLRLKFGREEMICRKLLHTFVYHYEAPCTCMYNCLTQNLIKLLNNVFEQQHSTIYENEEVKKMALLSPYITNKYILTFIKDYFSPAHMVT